jgi:hypothetical protein
LEVGVESGEPVCVHEHFSPLKSVPETIGFGLADAVVYPAGRDVVAEFVVEDCLEGRNDLRWVLERIKIEKKRNG